MKQGNILVLAFDGGRHLAREAAGLLRSNALFECEVREANLPSDPLGAESVSAVLAQQDPSTIVLCVHEGCHRHAPELIEGFRKCRVNVPVVLIEESARPREVCDILDKGVADYVTAPLNSVDLLPRIWRLQQEVHEPDPLVQQLKEKLGLQQFIGESPKLIEQLKKIPAVAKCDANVMITGETGTGKEICARSIHYLSGRADHPFIPVNCGAIPAELVENELFGHEQGAFTGAASASAGLVKEADRGTLFLDELDALPPKCQVALLRLIQEKEFRSLGSRKICRSDVRIIAACNQNLEALVRKGALREDLYYRLSVIPISLPPLRERGEDAVLLAAHFLEKFRVELGKSISGFAQGALRRLTFHRWPGNVRELENVIFRAAVLCKGETIQPNEIDLPVPVENLEKVSFKVLKAKAVSHFERTYLLDMLRANDGNITRAARAAGKNRRAFFELVRKHRIRVQWAGRTVRSCDEEAIASNGEPDGGR